MKHLFLKIKATKLEVYISFFSNLGKEGNKICTKMLLKHRTGANKKKWQGKRCLRRKYARNKVEEKWCRKEENYIFMCVFVVYAHSHTPIYMHFLEKWDKHDSKRCYTALKLSKFNLKRTKTLND